MLLSASVTPRCASASRPETLTTVETGRWSRGEKWTAASVIVGILAIVAALIVPEVRRAVHLDKPTDIGSTVKIPETVHSGSHIWHGKAPDLPFKFDANTHCAWDAKISDIKISARIDDTGAIQDGLLKFTYSETPIMSGCSTGIRTTFNAIPLDTEQSHVTGDNIDLEFHGGNGSRPVVKAQFTGPFTQSSGQSSIDGVLVFQRTDAERFGHANWRQELGMFLSK